MSKNTYTNEEIQQMLESLFHEKKKAKHLQQELHSLSQERNQLHEKLETLQQQKFSKPQAPNPDTALLLEFKENLKRKEAELSKTHLQLLEKQRDLVTLKGLLEQRRDPEDQESLERQIDKLKEIALSYKEKALQEAEALRKNYREHQELKQAYEDQSDDNNSLKQQVEKLRSWFKATEEKLQATELELQDMRKKSEAFDFTITQFTEENRRAQARQIVLHESLEDLQDANAAQKQKIEQLNEMLKVKEAQLLELQEADTTLKKSVTQQQALEAALQAEEEKNRALTSSKEILEKQLGDVKLHAEQVDKGIHYLRLKMEEYKLENQQLGEELTLSQELTEKMTEDMRLIKEEASQHKITFETERKAKDEALEELATLQSQFGQMKNQILDHSQLIQKKSDEFTLTQRTIQALQKDKHLLENILSDKNSLVQSLEKELNLIKQILSKGNQEASDLEEKNRSLSDQCSKISTEANQLKMHMTQLQDDLRKLQVEKQRINQLETKCLQLNQSDEEKQVKISHLSQEIHRLNDSYKNMQAQLEEKDAQLKIAQQHLARKVKENTLLNERAEEQKNLLVELQNQLQSVQGKMSEMRQTLEHKKLQENRLQEVLNETIKTSEAQLKAREEKYDKLYEQWTEMESANKELKKLEEKHAQMQALMTNFRNMLGGSEPPPEIRQENPTPPPELTPPPPSQPPPMRYKKNLFD